MKNGMNIFINIFVSMNNYQKGGNKNEKKYGNSKVQKV